MRRPTLDEVTIFPDAPAFRAWLAAHHASATQLWVGYYRTGVSRAAMRYPEAVDEALCFGWIDGIGYRVNEEVHANRFTPRARRSTWSSGNVRRAEELRAAGRMHPAGLAAFAARTTERSGIYSYENRPADLPAAYRARLAADPDAARWWDSQAPGYRRTATWWVLSARRPETRERRLVSLIADSAAGRPAKPFRYGRTAVPKTAR